MNSKKNGGSQKGIKGEIVVDYLSRFSKSPTMTIARLLVADHPELFLSVESARSLIRWHRGEHNKSKKEPMRTEKERKNANAWRKLPESDYEKTAEFILPKGNNRVLILNDIHFPYQDNEALSIALNYGRENKCNAILLNGDIMDCYQTSRFIKDPRLRDMAGEIEMIREFLELLYTEFNCPIYYKIGNHEDRWENYLKTNAPALIGIDDFELQHVLRFGQFGVQLIKSKQLIRIGKLRVLHGHEFGMSVFSPVNVARGLYTRAKASSAIGHHHATSEHSEKDLDGEVVTTWSIGCLCGLSPDYLPFNKWNHGFAFVTLDDEGGYEFRNLRIIDGKVR
jgi:predicted phosphodiesterase